uniref:tRNA (guanine(9)-N(1))-methyltransferase n=1 Tax=Kalanchoe fedtschenkoi TaxID=63787 RepID=A0A7N0UCY4_KALFE
MLRFLLLKTLILPRRSNFTSPLVAGTPSAPSPVFLPVSSVFLLPHPLSPHSVSVSVCEELGVMDVVSNEQSDAAANAEAEAQPGEQQMSKRAQKKLLKQQRYEAKKAQKKAAEKEHKKREADRKRKEWDEKLSGVDEEERAKLFDARRGLRMERMEKRNEEKADKIERLAKAKEHGQNIVIDLEFAHLMSPNEINSLTQQITYCYAMNGRCSSPSHLWLTGCSGDMETQLQKIPGYPNWIIEKESRSYIEALHDRKDDLVYLTADSETMLDSLDPKKLYIVGGLVDRNRWKGITMNKATEQGIQTAKLPIGEYLKMSSSQVLTVNQVIEILLKFLETGDWKTSFFHVIPQRKRHEADLDVAQGGKEEVRMEM